MSITRTKRTEEQYLKRAAQLLKRAKDYYGKEISAVQFAEFIIEHRFDYTPATFRQYKAAIIFYLEQNESLYPDIDSAINALIDTSQSDCAKITERTSQLRKKDFDLDQLNKVIFAISLSQNQYARLTANWLRCGVLTGLRPHEWEFIQLLKENDKTFLVVKNAKNTNGRSHGEFRHIDISLFQESDKRILDDFLLELQDHVDRAIGGFVDVQAKCMHFLNNINDKLIKGKFDHPYFKTYRGSGVYRHGQSRPKRITLYSARHHFSSMAKYNLLSLQEVAALMGHKTDKTASEHYGKRSYGRKGKFKVKPVTEEVEKIEVKYNNTRTDVKNNIAQTQPVTDNIPTKTINPSRRR